MKTCDKCKYGEMQCDGELYCKIDKTIRENYTSIVCDDYERESNDKVRISTKETRNSNGNEKYVLE